MKPWWTRYLPDAEIVLFALCVLGLIVLLLVLLAARSVRELFAF